MAKPVLFKEPMKNLLLLGHFLLSLALLRSLLRLGAAWHMAHLIKYRASQYKYLVLEQEVGKLLYAHSLLQVGL